MGAAQLAVPLQGVEVSASGHARDAERLRELGHLDGGAPFQHGHDLHATFL